MIKYNYDDHFLEMFHATSVYHVNAITLFEINTMVVHYHPLSSLYHCNIVSVKVAASLSGSQSLLPAVRLRPAGLRRKTHRHGDDEGHPGDPAVEVHGLSSSRLHRQHHQADQQSLHAARGRGSRLPGHALHSTSSEYLQRPTPERKNTGLETFKGALSNFLSPKILSGKTAFFFFTYYTQTVELTSNSMTHTSQRAI